jgi:hypothetical protein
MFTKMFVGIALVLSSLVLILGAAPAGADPSRSSTDPNPFGSLTCNCQQTTPGGAPAAGELDRGIQDALSH